jgi:hypothetical protein
MHAPRLRDRLRVELESRRLANPRYSIRAFAAFLGTDHSTLSQVLHGRRAVPARRVAAWGHKLQLCPEEVAVYAQGERGPSMRLSVRMGDEYDRVHEWTAEAAELITRIVHWEILQRCRPTAVAPDCRRLASELCVTVDDVQNALTRLLRLRLVAVGTTGEWVDLTGGDALTAPTFRQLALRRIRESAGITPDGVPWDVGFSPATR